MFPRPGRPIARILHVGLEYDAPPGAGDRGPEGRSRRHRGAREISRTGRRTCKPSTPRRSPTRLRYWLEDYARYLEVDSRCASGSGTRPGPGAAGDRIPRHPPCTSTRPASSMRPRRQPADRGGDRRSGALRAPVRRAAAARSPTARASGVYAPGRDDRAGGRPRLLDVRDRARQRRRLDPGRRGESRELTVLDAGAAFGEISLLTGRSAHGDRPAVTETTLVEIEKGRRSRRSCASTRARRRRSKPRWKSGGGTPRTEFDASREQTGKRRRSPALAERIARFFGL